MAPLTLFRIRRFVVVVFMALNVSWITITLGSGGCSYSYLPKYILKSHLTYFTGMWLLAIRLGLDLISPAIRVS